MANNINKIGFQITGYNYTRQEETTSKNSSEKTSKKLENEKSKLAAKDVLNFMAATKTDLVPINKTQKNIDVNKYVNQEQADRIAEFMKSFEEDYEALTQTAISEFGISENTANKIALSFIDSSY